MLPWPTRASCLFASLDATFLSPFILSEGGGLGGSEGSNGGATKMPSSPRHWTHPSSGRRPPSPRCGGEKALAIYSRASTPPRRIPTNVNRDHECESRSPQRTSHSRFVLILRPRPTTTRAQDEVQKRTGRGTPLMPICAVPSQTPGIGVAQSGHLPSTKRYDVTRKPRRPITTPLQ